MLKKLIHNTKEYKRGYLFFPVAFAQETDSFFGSAREFLASADVYIRGVLSLILFISIVGIIYLSFRFSELGRVNREKNNASVPPPSKSELHERWERIMVLSDSINPQDRKIAVIEADNILDELVTRLGYSGETLGARLKNIEVGDFATLDEAWMAHKARNAIAHENKEPSRREAKKIISLYEQVFSEFEYI